MPIEPDVEGVTYSNGAREFWSNEWNGESFMAIGMADFVLGKDVMDESHSVIRHCPPPLEMENAQHFVQEWGEEVARAALASFGISTG